MDKVLLTGATGFIGSHVAEALTGAGLRVVALVRPRADRSLLTALNAELRPGDIHDAASVREAVRGCDGVVHVAARAKDWGRRQEFQQTNVAGTHHVLEACRTEGIGHVIITGSISSYGEEDSSSVKDETSPCRPHYPYLLHRVFPSAMNWYRETKAESTRQAVAFAERHHLNLTVIEPAWVFGEREFGTGFYAYVRAAKRGLRFAPGSTRNRFHVIYAPDLAKAYRLACQRQPPGIERLIVGSPAAEPMHRVFGLFCQEAGVPPPHLVPKWVVYPLAFAWELLYTMTRSAQPPLLTRSRVNTFYDSIQFSPDKARRMLGFDCEYTLEQGIRRTVAWYQRNRFI